MAEQIFPDIGGLRCLVYRCGWDDWAGCHLFCRQRSAADDGCACWTNLRAQGCTTSSVSTPNNACCVRSACHFAWVRRGGFFSSKPVAPLSAKVWWARIETKERKCRCLCLTWPCRGTLRRSRRFERCLFLLRWTICVDISSKAAGGEAEGAAAASNAGVREGCRVCAAAAGQAECLVYSGGEGWGERKARKQVLENAMKQLAKERNSKQ